MIESDFQPNFKINARAELTGAQYKAFVEALAAVALDGVVEVKATEIKPPKVEEPLIELPEHLRGSLGNISFDDYRTKLEQAGKSKSYIFSSWNILPRVGALNHPESEIWPRSLTSSLKGKSRHGYYMAVEEAREQGYSINLNKLADFIESDDWKKTTFGVGRTTVQMWAEIVNEDIARLEQSESALPVAEERDSSN